MLGATVSQQCVSAHSCGEIWATGTARAHASAGEFVEGVPHAIIATVRAWASDAANSAQHTKNLERLEKELCKELNKLG